MRTLRFFRASPAAMFRAHVVFPTPPLLLTIAITRWGNRMHMYFTHVFMNSAKIMNA